MLWRRAWTAELTTSIQGAPGTQNYWAWLFSDAAAAESPRMSPSPTPPSARFNELDLDGMMSLVFSISSEMKTLCSHPPSNSDPTVYPVTTEQLNCLASPCGRKSWMLAGKWRDLPKHIHIGHEDIKWQPRKIAPNCLLFLSPLKLSTPRD